MASTLELLVAHSLHTLREFFLVDDAVAIDTIDEGKGLGQAAWRLDRFSAT